MAASSLKTHRIISSSVRTNAQMTLYDGNDTPVLWVDTITGLACGPVMALHSASRKGPTLAASTISHSNGSAYLILGDPVAAIEADKDWMRFECTGSLFKSTYNFDHEGVRYIWKRTHDSALGASKFGTKDFVLLRADDEAKPLLALVAKDSVKYAYSFQELSDDLEALALISILPVVGRVKKVHVPPVISTAMIGWNPSVGM